MMKLSRRMALSHWIRGLLLFGVLPAFISYLRPHQWMYVLLWLLALGTVLWLRHHGIRWSQEWNVAALTRAELRRIFVRFIPLAIALTLFMWWIDFGRLFSLPRERPLVWVMVMILYPLLSAMPQEIVYRSFIFRYYRFLPEKFIILISAAAFGWVHIILQNWVAVTFSAIGGALFAHTYAKTKSLAACCFEHALYGCYLFTIGMGMYFYHGMAVH